MVKEPSKPAPRNETSDFLRFADLFHEYFIELTRRTAESLDNEADRKYAQTPSSAIGEITGTLRQNLRVSYKRVGGDAKQFPDRQTKNLGAVPLVENVMNLMQQANTKSGLWDKIMEIHEAIKKILTMILHPPIAGPLNDIIKQILDFLSPLEGILWMIDNLLQTIGDLFGGKKLQQRMVDQELTNLRVLQEIEKLRNIRAAFPVGQVNSSQDTA